MDTTSALLTTATPHMIMNLVKIPIAETVDTLTNTDMDMDTLTNMKRRRRYPCVEKEGHGR
jgi:hypothetical protein